MSIEFSVIIPTHNRQEMLSRAIASVAIEAQGAVEVIVVDDGSNPEAEVESSANIILLRQECSSGPGAARNRGISFARGRWISFLDDDDELLPEFFSAMKQSIAANPQVDFFWSSVEFLNYAEGRPNGSSHRIFKEGFVDRQDMFVEALSIGTGFGLTVKASCFQQIGSFDTSFSITEDIEFIMRMLASGLLGASVPTLGVRVHNHCGTRLTDAAYNQRRASQCAQLLALYPEFIGRNDRVARQLRAHINSLDKRVARDWRIDEELYDS